MNKISKLFNIKYSIIQGGMICCSGLKPASAVSNSGGIANGRAKAGMFEGDA